jgi:tight adherence protein B
VVLTCGLVGAVGGLLLAGPVGSAIAGAYAVLGAVAWANRRSERRSAAARTAAVDAIGALAADLRAGLPAATALVEALPALRPAGDPTVTRAARLVGGAMQVADRLGAPLAVLLERVDTDLRAAERSRATVTAQTAGARATAWLLAALPLGGVGLGYGMGGDPGRVLLHTPLGAGCALGALLLQCAGLAWTARLCRTAVAEPS